MNMHSQHLARRAGIGLAALAIATALAACGGGGGNPGATVGTGSPNSSTASPTMALAMVDSSGASISTLSGGQTATVKATVKTASGGPAASAIVQFTTSASGLLDFTPASASAMTDDNGVAVISVKPNSITSAGALSVTASTVLDGKTATASFNMAVGASPVSVGTLAFGTPLTGPLPAFSTLSLNIPLTSGGQPVDSVSGLIMTSLCVGDGRATLVPGNLAKGVQTATYTNNGCLRGRDTITVSVGNSSQSLGLDVSPANIGAIQFSGTSISGNSIVLKGSGGLGRSEAAQVTFRVVDQHNNGLAGVDVRFSATTYTGGLAVSPLTATTDSTGSVSTMVSSGTIPTPVRVIAEATRNGVTISGMSDTLVISTGLPIQKSMSISADHYNIEGHNIDNQQAKISVLLADQYGNPVSDNTAINFVTEGGAIGSSASGGCVTLNGSCTVVLRSQEFRPVNGRVTVLAYLQGIEDFLDQNGDGQYTCKNYIDSSGKVPANYRPLVDTCVSGGESFIDQGDPFLDTGSPATTTGVPGNRSSLDGTYEPAKGDLPFPFNRATYSATGDGKWGLNYIRRSVEIVFSGSDPVLIRQVCTGDSCRDWIDSDGNASVITGVAGAGCSAKPLSFRLVDSNNNPMPSGTTVTSSDTDKLSLDTVFPNAVPSTNAIGGTIHTVTVKPDTACAAGAFRIKVTTPSGKTTLYPFRSS